MRSLLIITVAAIVLIVGTALWLESDTRSLKSGVINCDDIVWLRDLPQERCK